MFNLKRTQLIIGKELRKGKGWERIKKEFLQAGGTEGQWRAVLRHIREGEHGLIKKTNLSFGSIALIAVLTAGVLLSAFADVKKINPAHPWGLFFYSAVIDGLNLLAFWFLVNRFSEEKITPGKILLYYVLTILSALFPYYGISISLLVLFYVFQLELIGVVLIILFKVLYLSGVSTVYNFFFA